MTLVCIGTEYTKRKKCVCVQYFIYNNLHHVVSGDYLCD